MAEDWRERLSRRNPEKIKTPSVAWIFLVLVGIWFFCAPWLHGADFFQTEAGGLFLRTSVTFLFFFCAYFLYSIHRLRSELKESVDELNVVNQALFGKEWRARRDAIAILINSLSSPKEDLKKLALENLRKLTGEDFGSDAEKWSSWWDQSRDTFRGPMRKIDEEPKAG